MVFDIEKAQEQRKEIKEKRKQIKEPVLENFPAVNIEEGKTAYSVFLELSNHDYRILNIRADNPAEAIEKMRIYSKLSKEQIYEPGCRARDIETRKLYSVSGEEL